MRTRKTDAQRAATLWASSCAYLAVLPETTCQGGVNVNETSAEAVIREVFEETGHHFPIDRLVFIQEQFYNINNAHHHEINNLVQNSIQHNPQGCTIHLCLDCSDNTVSLTVADNGVGLSAEKLRELEEKPHYMESTDERLDLRHGLGLLLVRQIVEAHGGTMIIKSVPQKGYQTILTFQIG